MPHCIHCNKYTTLRTFYISRNLVKRDRLRECLLDNGISNARIDKIFSFSFMGNQICRVHAPKYEFSDFSQAAADRPPLEYRQPQPKENGNEDPSPKNSSNFMDEVFVVSGREIVDLVKMSANHSCDCKDNIVAIKAIGEEGSVKVLMECSKPNCSLKSGWKTKRREFQILKSDKQQDVTKDSPSVSGEYDYSAIKTASHDDGPLEKRARMEDSSIKDLLIRSPQTVNKYTKDDESSMNTMGNGRETKNVLSPVDGGFYGDNVLHPSESSTATPESDLAVENLFLEEHQLWNQPSSNKGNAVVSKKRTKFEDLIREQVSIPHQPFKTAIIRGHRECEICKAQTKDWTRVLSTAVAKEMDFFLGTTIAEKMVTGVCSHLIICSSHREEYVRLKKKSSRPVFVCKDSAARSDDFQKPSSYESHLYSSLIHQNPPSESSTVPSKVVSGSALDNREPSLTVNNLLNENETIAREELIGNGNQDATNTSYPRDTVAMESYTEVLSPLVQKVIKNEVDSGNSGAPGAYNPRTINTASNGDIFPPLFAPIKKEVGEEGNYGSGIENRSDSINTATSGDAHPTLLIQKPIKGEEENYGSGIEDRSNSINIARDIFPPQKPIKGEVGESSGNNTSVVIKHDQDDMISAEQLITQKGNCQNLYQRVIKEEGMEEEDVICLD